MGVSPVEISLKILPIFLIICGGAFARHMKWITREGDSSIMKLLVSLFVPCLAFHHIVQNPALQNPSNIWLPPALGIFSILLGIIIAWAVMRLARPGERKPRRTFALTIGIYNYGYFAIPLLIALYGERALGVQFLFNLGVEITLWSVGVALLRDPGENLSLGQNIRRAITTPVVVILISMGMNLSGIGEWVPEPIMGATDFLGRCAVPIGVLLVGANLYDLIRETPDWYKDWKTPLLACALRLGIVPLIFLMICSQLPLTLELKQICVIAASVPSGIFPIVLARMYGGDTLVALRVVISTTALGIFTLPLWVSFGESFLGVVPN